MLLSEANGTKVEKQSGLYGIAVSFSHISITFFIEIWKMSLKYQCKIGFPA